MYRVPFRRTGRWHVAWLAALAMCCGSPPGRAAGDDAAAARLAEGNKGIAARYPGDVGLEQDKQVIFVERFDEASLEALARRWESVQNKEILSFSPDVPAGSGDKRSLLMTHVGGRSDGAHLYRRLPENYQRTFTRFYVKFAKDCAPIHHFFHVGGYDPPTAWPQGGAGMRPGGERFTTGVEPFGDAWRWDFYSYWSAMRGSPPRGQCWGNSFLHDRKHPAQRDRWTCLELMMQTNDVGQSNGEQALWIDGKLVAHLGQGFPKGKWIYDKFTAGEGGATIRWDDQRGGPVRGEVPEGGAPFEGFRFRTDKRQGINFVWVLLYLTKAPRDHTSQIWFDNIVVAKDYIGPIQPPAKSP